MHTRAFFILRFCVEKWCTLVFNWPYQEGLISQLWCVSSTIFWWATYCTLSENKRGFFIQNYVCKKEIWQTIQLMASIIILHYVFNSLIHFEISKNAYLEFESDVYLIHITWRCVGLPIKEFFYSIINVVPILNILYNDWIKWTKTKQIQAMIFQ